MEEKLELKLDEDIVFREFLKYRGNNHICTLMEKILYRGKNRRFRTGGLYLVILRASALY